MKWKGLVAVPLMIGVTAGGASAGLSNPSSGRSKFMVLIGVYDPAPQHESVTYSASGKLRLNLDNQRAYGWIIYNGRRVQVSWKYKVIKSSDFKGYTMLPASRARELNMLEVVAYTNGTVWVFVKDLNGGLIAIKGISRELVNTLDHAQVATRIRKPNWKLGHGIVSVWVFHFFVVRIHKWGLNV